MKLITQVWRINGGLIKFKSNRDYSPLSIHQIYLFNIGDSLFHLAEVIFILFGITTRKQFKTFLKNGTSSKNVSAEKRPSDASINRYREFFLFRERFRLFMIDERCVMLEESTT